MAAYKYVGNKIEGDWTARIVLKRSSNGEPIEFLDLGGSPAEVPDDVAERLEERFELEKASKKEVDEHEQERKRARVPRGLPEDYDDLTAEDVVKLLDTAPPRQRKAIQRYEAQNQSRKTILEHEVQPAQDEEIAGAQPDSPAAQPGQSGVEVELGEGAH